MGKCGTVMVRFSRPLLLLSDFTSTALGHGYVRRLGVEYLLRFRIRTGIAISCACTWIEDVSAETMLMSPRGF